MLRICYAIYPYRIGEKWFFDDPSVDLFQEGLTDGVPELLLKACYLGGVDSNSFVVNFSTVRYPKSNMLIFLNKFNDGNYYKWYSQQMKCWFCPALLRYFNFPPPRIYFQVLRTQL